MDVVFPAVCPGCGRSGAVLCDRCASGLMPAPAMAVPAGLDGLVVACAYEGVARELVARVKYRNARGALDWLAAEMVGAGRPAAVDVVTWVPTTAARRRARGFDHAELLARAVGRRLRVPVRSLLVRAPGPAQTGAPREARDAGPRLRARPVARDRRALLVDDVVTTGATMTAAAGALRRAGARSVHGLAAARTPRPGR